MLWSHPAVCLFVCACPQLQLSDRTTSTICKFFLQSLTADLLHPSHKQTPTFPAGILEVDSQPPCRCVATTYVLQLRLAVYCAIQLPNHCKLPQLEFLWCLQKKAAHVICLPSENVATMQRLLDMSKQLWHALTCSACLEKMCRPVRPTQGLSTKFVIKQMTKGARLVVIMALSE